MVISRIQSLIQERYGKNYTVECFGSTQYGADSPDSDLDLVVVVSHVAHIYNVQWIKQHNFRITKGWTALHQTLTWKHYLVNIRNCCSKLLWNLCLFIISNLQYEVGSTSYLRCAPNLITISETWETRCAKNSRSLTSSLRRQCQSVSLNSLIHIVISVWSSMAVKLRDQKGRIRCDINVNDQMGVYNTLLIARYCKLSPLLRPLLLAVKKWAKSFGLNNPSGEQGPTTFSSYSLTLMSIGFLQVSMSMLVSFLNISQPEEFSPGDCFRTCKKV